ncbi:ribokinase [Galactobacter caseinivorans]|uniref:ribokinase n=1 Tax=Galactobacter caseinivorans TaxID=2676123 RepID=UPI0018F33E67|nr:ribokinase [Galactobacter caseinivorans]
MTNIDITVLGSANLDITATVPRLPGPGETLLGTSLTHSPGGKGANQALAASRAGATVRFIGAVGQDAAAAQALELLEADGVDLEHLLRVETEPTGTALIAVDEAGENNIIVIPGANAALDADAVRAQADQIRGLLVLQGEVPASGLAAAVAVAPGRVVLNLAPVIEVPREVFLAADPLVVNEHEGALALTQLGGQPQGLGEAEVVAALRAKGVPSVVMTLGAQGALVSGAPEQDLPATDLQATDLPDDAGSVRVPRVKVAAVDATGAGDAFVGALAARLAAGEGLVAAATYAARFAADTVTRPGAQASYPAAGAPLG